MLRCCVRACSDTRSRTSQRCYHTDLDGAVSSQHLHRTANDAGTGDERLSKPRNTNTGPRWEQRRAPWVIRPKLAESHLSLQPTNSSLIKTERQMLHTISTKQREKKKTSAITIIQTSSVPNTLTARPPPSEGGWGGEAASSLYAGSSALFKQQGRESEQTGTDVPNKHVSQSFWRKTRWLSFPLVGLRSKRGSWG